jgi:hypothetical protein
MDAVENPTVRKYNRKEVSTEDLPMPQRVDVDLHDLVRVIRGETNPDVGGRPLTAEYMEELAFNEEPVTIRIEENARSDFPETHVPVFCDGRGAEVLMNGAWASIGWLPIGIELTVKRKYLEVLIRSKVEIVRTVHDDADVEKPKNTLNRRKSSSYPTTIISDQNPRGHAWATAVRNSH